MRKKIYVNAMVTYSDCFEAENFEEAIGKFVKSCPYAFEPDSICVYDEETGEKRTNFS